MEQMCRPHSPSHEGDMATAVRWTLVTQVRLEDAQSTPLFQNEVPKYTGYIDLPRKSRSQVTCV